MPAAAAFSTRPCKHAVVGMIRELARELAPDVRVNGVGPGGTLTNLRGTAALGHAKRSIADRAAEAEARIAAGVPLRFAQEPEDHTGIYVLLASRENSRGHHRRSHHERRRSWHPLVMTGRSNSMQDKISLEQHPAAPEGFEIFGDPGGFVHRNGPLYIDRQSTAPTVKLRLGPQHTNSLRHRQRWPVDDGPRHHARDQCQQGGGLPRRSVPPCNSAST